MSIVHVITHPEVVIDPSEPVTQWPLAPEGVRRMRLALGRPWIGNLGAVFSSAEQKATDAARLVADRLSLAPVVADLGENDCSATGCLPKVEFGFTAEPQPRVLRACGRLLALRFYSIRNTKSKP